MTKGQPQYDYSEYTDSGPKVGDNVIARLTGLATDQAHAEARVARLEQELKEAKESLRHISENQIPTLMEELELEEYKTNGLHIKLASVIRGSIPKANEAEAFQWLEDNNHANLIKRQFTIEFGKDEEKWANKFERDLRQRKKQLNCKRQKSVHAQTLQSFVRQQLEEGVAIPMDVFGVFRQNFSKVKVDT